METIETLILPIALFVGLGAAAGIILVISSRIFKSEVNPKIAEITAALPGINCGACGYSGCENYASAAANGTAAANLCKPGGAETALKIGAITGAQASASARETAVVLCKGSPEFAETKYLYDGTETCRSAYRRYKGEKSCGFGCAGYGDCAKVCDYGAIKVIGNVAVVNPSLCAACGKCVKECPQKIIALKKANVAPYVGCSSTEIGKKTKANCKVGCIACKLCARKCPEKAITVENNKASINYAKCTGCGACVEVCPTKAVNLQICSE